MKKKYTLGGLSKMLSAYWRAELRSGTCYYYGTSEGRMGWELIRRYVGELILRAGCLPTLQWRLVEFGTGRVDVYILAAKPKSWPRILRQLLTRLKTGYVPVLTKGVELRCMPGSGLELVFQSAAIGSAFIKKHQLKVDGSKVMDALLLARRMLGGRVDLLGEFISIDRPAKLLPLRKKKPK